MKVPEKLFFPSHHKNFHFVFIAAFTLMVDVIRGSPFRSASLFVILIFAFELLFILINIIEFYSPAQQNVCFLSKAAFAFYR